jgi:hypothetical protein
MSCCSLWCHVTQAHSRLDLFARTAPPSPLPRPLAPSGSTKILESLLDRAGSAHRGGGVCGAPCPVSGRSVHAPSMLCHRGMQLDRYGLPGENNPLRARFRRAFLLPGRLFSIARMSHAFLPPSTLFPGPIISTRDARTRQNLPRGSPSFR